MRRAAILLAAVALLAALPALVIAGCSLGSDDDEPAAQPARRFGEREVAAMVAVEEVRARLSPVSDLVALGRHDAAAVHLAEARELWEALRPRSARRDPVLAREIDVAFDRVRRALAARATFDTVRDVAGPLQSQLFGGVREDLVPKEARFDDRVNAATLVRLLDRLVAAYETGDAEGWEHAFGLTERSQAVARELAPDLGPQRDAVVEGLKELRQAAWPEGLAQPAGRAPAAEIAGRARAIRAALAERF